MPKAPATEETAGFGTVKAVTGLVIRLEEWLLSILLAVMIVLACYQIGLRWFTSGGLPWIDPFLRHLVLWSGLFGAALATATGNHIALDLVSYLVRGRVRHWLKFATNGFSTVVAAFLFRAALLFIDNEIEFGSAALFGFPSWLWNLIFPIAFGMICAHFAIATLASAAALFLPARHNPSGPSPP